MLGVGFSRTGWEGFIVRTTRQLSITLPNGMADALRERVASGAYASESEVVRDGLRALFARRRSNHGYVPKPPPPTTNFTPTRRRQSAPMRCAGAWRPTMPSASPTTRRDSKGRLLSPSRTGPQRPLRLNCSSKLARDRRALRFVGLRPMRPTRRLSDGRYCT